MSWAELPLAALADVRSGGGAPQDADDFSDEGHPFVRAGSLIKLLSGTTEDSLEKLAPEVANRHGLKLFPAGTVLFAKSGMSATKGYIYTLRGEAYVVNHLAALVPRKNGDSAFLSHALQRFSPTTLIKDPGYPSIRLGDIEQMRIQAPREIAERRRVAAILDHADALRRKRRDALELTGLLPKAQFVRLFGDPIRNESSWSVDKLGNVGELERGVSKHRPRNDPILLGGAYPLIQTGDIANSDGYIRSFSSTYSDAGLRQSRLWGKGTLCITIAANIGKTAILTFDACFPDSVVGFSPSWRVKTEYVRHWLSFIQEQLEIQAPQSAQKNINLAILRNLDVPVPPIELQSQFEAFVDRFVAERKVAIDQLGGIDALFASLQHRAFRGEL